MEPASASGADDPGSSSKPEVRAFWTGPQLSPYEELSLRSFVAAGARVLLYSPEKALRVPDGVELVDVREILSSPVHQFTFSDGDRSPALHSDLFRYAALQQFGGWYADLDIVCIGTTLPVRKIYIARESDDLVNGAVLKFPAQSPVIAAAIDHAWKILPETQTGAPLRMRVSIGPALLTQLSRDYAFDHLVLPRSSAYEIGYDEIPAMFDPGLRGELDERVRQSDFVHLWNEIWRRTRIPKNYGPPKGSFLDGLFRRFGMEFSDEARLSAESIKVWFQERHFLTQVAARLGTDVVSPNTLGRLLAQSRRLNEISEPSPADESGGATIQKRTRAATTPQTVRTFWQGGPIGVYQLLCMRSFVERGHRVEVFTYDTDLGIPEWIERRNAADILPAERVLRHLPDEERVAIHADLFRHAVLHRLGGWWVDPDVVLLQPDLPSGDVFFGGPNEFNTVSTAALRFPGGHPVLSDALSDPASVGQDVANWQRAGASLLTQCLSKHRLLGAMQPPTAGGSISWFGVQRLFDPAQTESVEKTLEGAAFLDLHYEVWLRAGVPPYLGPPRGSYLDRLLERHDVGLRFSTRMEFDDLRRWLAHMYKSTERQIS